jgi:predicted Zn-dependent protease
MRIILTTILIFFLFHPMARAGFSIGGFSIGGSSDSDNNIDIGKVFDVIKHGKQAFSDIDEEEELEIGKQAAAVLTGSAPLLENKSLQQYINKVGYWLTLHTERPALSWRFGILNTESINAFATPGGYVFITLGLLNELQDEAELAGVLAHEIAHVLRRHHVIAIKSKGKG